MILMENQEIDLIKSPLILLFRIFLLFQLIGFSQFF